MYNWRMSIERKSHRPESNNLGPEQWAHQCRKIIHDASIVLEIAQKAEFEGYSEDRRTQKRYALELRGVISGLAELAKAL